MNLLDILRKDVRFYVNKLAVFLDSSGKGKISPNLITWISVSAHLPIAILIGLNHLILAAALLVFFGLFDVLDGELARLKKVASPKGMLLDASTDRVKEVMLYSGIAYYLSQAGYTAWAFVAVIACGASITVSYVKAKGEVAYSVEHKKIDHHALNRIFSEALVPFEVRIAILVAGLLFNQLLIAVALIAILASFSVFERSFAISKKI